MKGAIKLMEKEVEYISDGNYNFLRINCGEERKNTYSYKMITENAIKGLLPSRMRFVDGNTYLYYEIQSKQALYYRYETREINYEDLKNIFYHLCLLGKELEKYLLDFNDIDFDERFIYQNIETRETFFLFYPEKHQKHSFAVFMEYIVKKINHKDAKAVQISYKLYDISRKEYVLIQEIKQLFEEEISEVSGEKGNNNEVIQIKENKREWEIEEKELKTKGVPEWEYEENEKKIDKNKEKSKLVNILIPSALCIILTVLVCIKLSFDLTYNEEILIMGGMVVDIGIIIVYISYILHNKKNIVHGQKVSDEKEGSELFEGAIIEKIQENTEWDCKEWEKEENYGKTVFIEPEPENILCGLGKNEKIIIKMENFPFSVGKLKEEADYVLKDNSVSRLHARFYKEGKSIYLMDMNSTNGTYKNGFRIPPNEKILLEEGDEIAFGQIRFCYR